MTASARHPTLHWFLLIATLILIPLVSIGTLTREAFIGGYFASYQFWLEISLGALGILATHVLTGGAWGREIARPVEFSLATLPLMALLFVPVLFAAFQLFPWAKPEIVASVPEVARRAAAYNLPFFTVRALAYFALWIFAAARLRRIAFAPVSVPPQKNRRLNAGLTLLMLLLTITAAAFDWRMSLDEKWSATGFGALAISGCMQSGFAAAILAVSFRRGRKPERKVLIDLGNLLLMSVMFWAYLDFTQYLITWSGGLTRETQYYQARNHDGWPTAVVLMWVLGFIAPFILLLFRKIKSDPRWMRWMAAGILVSRWLENLIWVGPTQHLNFIASLTGGFITLILIGAPWFLAQSLFGATSPARTGDRDDRVERRRYTEGYKDGYEEANA